MMMQTIQGLTQGGLAQVFSASRRRAIVALARDAPIFVSADLIRDKFLVQLGQAFVAICLTHALIYRYMCKLADKRRQQRRTRMATTTTGDVQQQSSSSSTATTSSSKDDKDRHMLAYRFTNMIVCAAMGVLGVYGELVIIPHVVAARDADSSSGSSSSHTNVADFVQGLDDHYYMASNMIAFQLWAVIVGHYYVNESPVMMAHHVATITCCIMFGTFTNGFRYYCFYYGGVWEISSIPLALMNTWKDHPKWRERYPTINLLVRAVFAFSFLWLRLWVGMPKCLSYTTDLFSVFLASADKPILLQLFLLMLFVLSVFLTLLQVYWGVLIVNMVVRQTYIIVTGQAKKLIGKDL